MPMSKMQARPFQESDRAQLEQWRLAPNPDATLELMTDYVDDQTETAVVEQDGKLVLAITGAISIALGPLIKNPNASKLDIVQGLFLAEAALNYKAMQQGAVASYIVIPKKMEGYIHILKKLGYGIMDDNGIVMGRHLPRSFAPKVVAPTVVVEVESAQLPTKVDTNE